MHIYGKAQTNGEETKVHNIRGFPHQHLVISYQSLNQGPRGPPFFLTVIAQ